MALFVGCSYNEFPSDIDIPTISDSSICLNIETRAEIYNGKELDRNYFVSASDLENFVKFRQNTSKRSTFSVKEVKSYGFDSSQTLFYILNYDEGWEVVAADKRLQPTLAYGDSGEFTMDCDNEPMKFWMNMLADGVLQTRLRTADATSATTSTTASTNSDTPTISSSEEQYIDFWEVVGLSSKKSMEEQYTRAKYTYLIYSYDTVGELMRGVHLDTAWSQKPPWNTYCPFKTDGSNERAPAGCTAVAGAQLLYYFAQNLGWEISAPTTATCSGYINSYSRQFDGLSYNVWGNMAKNISDQTGNTYTTAALIAYVGSISEMDYGNDGSSASVSDFTDAIEELYGITSTTGSLWDYDTDVIISNLQNNIPVIIWGAENIFGGGHSWIIDGYHKTTYSTVNFYVESDTPIDEQTLNSMNLLDADYTTTTNTLIVETFHMNFGWGSYYNDFYSMIPEWSFTDNKGNTITYDVVMRLYYNFAQNN